MRVCVYFHVHMHKEILKDYPGSVVGKCGSLVHRGKGWKARFLCLPLPIFCFPKQQEVLFSVQKVKQKNKTKNDNCRTSMNI